MKYTFEINLESDLAGTNIFTWYIEALPITLH